MISTVLIFVSIVSHAQSICYFPAVYQGEYVSQAVMHSDMPNSQEISYSTISVLYDSIPVWGYCHRRIGNNVILMDDFNAPLNKSEKPFKRAAKRILE